MASVNINATSIDDNTGVINGGGTYEEGTEVILTAFPKKGCKFVGWYAYFDTPVYTWDQTFTSTSTVSSISYNSISSENPWTFTATEDVTVEALFVISSKVPLSLYDDLAENVGVALGIEASQSDTLEINLNTVWDKNIILSASADVTDELTGVTSLQQVSMSAFDLLNSGGGNSVKKKNTIREISGTPTPVYANVIVCMTGAEYDDLKNSTDGLDPHTLYFLSTPPNE